MTSRRTLADAAARKASMRALLSATTSAIWTREIREARGMRILFLPTKAGVGYGRSDNPSCPVPASGGVGGGGAVWEMGV